MIISDPWDVIPIETLARTKMSTEGLDYETARSRARDEIVARKRKPNPSETKAPEVVVDQAKEPAVEVKEAENTPAEPRTWPVMARLADKAAAWDLDHRPAYLCHRAILAYQHRRCCIERELKRDGATEFDLFEFTETIGSKLVLLIPIALVMGAVVGLPYWIVAGWFHLPIVETLRLWPPTKWVLAGELMAMIGGVVYLQRCTIKQQAFGYVQDGWAILAFQGTTGLAHGVLTDGALLPWGWPARHFGFERAWGQLRPKVVSWLERVKRDHHGLVLTGHSLGGAMAMIAARELSDRVPVQAVVTFGAPRPGLYVFHRAYSKKRRGPELASGTLGEVTYRYMHTTDLVPRLPPPLLYWHVGKALYLDVHGSINDKRPPNVLWRGVIDWASPIDQASERVAGRMNWKPEWSEWLKWVMPADEYQTSRLTAMPFEEVSPLKDFVDSMKRAIGWQWGMMTPLKYMVLVWLGNVAVVVLLWVSTVVTVLGGPALVVSTGVREYKDGLEHLVMKYMKAFCEHSKWTLPESESGGDDCPCKTQTSAEVTLEVPRDILG